MHKVAIQFHVRQVSHCSVSNRTKLSTQLSLYQI